MRTTAGEPTPEEIVAALTRAEERGSHAEPGSDASYVARVRVIASVWRQRRSPPAPAGPGSARGVDLTRRRHGGDATLWAYRLLALPPGC